MTTFMSLHTTTEKPEINRVPGVETRARMEFVISTSETHPMVGKEHINRIVQVGNLESIKLIIQNFGRDIISEESLNIAYERGDPSTKAWISENFSIKIPCNFEQEGEPPITLPLGIIEDDPSN